MLKRSFETAFGTAMLILLLPLFGVIAAAIKLAGGEGPVLCQQQRETKDGGRFLMWRFRCLAGGLPEQTHPSLVGVWLRQHNLDRLPVLLNVIRGDIGLDELGDELGTR